MAVLTDKTYFNRDSADVGASPFGIFVNQAGYLPRSSKIAAIPFECGSFEVINESGRVVFSGKTENRGFDKDSGDSLRTGDFSQLEESGSYRIRAGGKVSAVFEISDKAYNNPLRDMLRAFYFLRCGSGLEEKYAGVYKHAPCHNGTAIFWEDRSVTAEVSGGWHDAGDYGRYVTAGACALAHLFYAYLTFPELEKLEMNIPESGNGTPDILNECRWELEWILKMQREDGGVYHKVTTAMHAPFVMPEEDNEQLWLFAVSSMAVADTAAICALASRIYMPYDKEFSERLYNAALLSYKWLDENPDFVPFSNPEGCNTGGYGEWEDRSNRFWAAAEMFALTGNEKYHEDFKRLLGESFNRTGLGYGDVGGLASLAYLRFAENADENLKNIIKTDFINEAKRLKSVADESGYSVAMSEMNYHWGSNMDAMKHGMIFIIADIITGEKEYAPYAQRLADYLMGYNALGISYVTGTGEYRCNYPHLRPAHADGIEECIPGMVSGGPNRTPNDPDAKALVPEGTPPMKCFADDVGCYSLNEITIYWNSPAVFVFAWLFSGLN